MLSLTDAVRDNEVVFIEGFLGESNAGATLNQRFPVSLMCRFSQVFMLLQLAIPFAAAAIANEWRFHQIGARSRILRSGRDDLNVLLDFLGDSRGVFADAFGNAFEGYAMEQAVLNLDTIFKGEVLARAGVRL